MPEDGNKGAAEEGAPFGADGDAPLYRAERSADDSGRWRVVGPNGAVGVYRLESEAQAKADQLNEDVAEEQENDFEPTAIFSIRRLAAAALKLRRFRPPFQIVGKAWKGLVELLAGAGGGLSFSSSAARSDRLRSCSKHHHAHLGENRSQIVPSGRRRSARPNSCKGGRPPEPFLQEWSVRFFKPGCGPQLYSPVMKTKASAATDLGCERLHRFGRGAVRISLYMRSSIGRPIALASTSSTIAARPRTRRRHSRRAGRPSDRDGTIHRRQGFDQPSFSPH